MCCRQKEVSQKKDCLLGDDMALAIPLENETDYEATLDITANLESLQFESGLSEIEKRYLNIRTRSHALTVYACAQATYFVSILNEARLINKLYNYFLSV